MHLESKNIKIITNKWLSAILNKNHIILNNLFIFLNKKLVTLKKALVIPNKALVIPNLIGNLFNKVPDKLYCVTTKLLGLKNFDVRNVILICLILISSISFAQKNKKRNQNTIQQNYQLISDTVWQNEFVYTTHWDTIYIDNPIVTNNKKQNEAFEVFADTVWKYKLSPSVHVDTVVVHGITKYIQDTVWLTSLVAETHFDTIYKNPKIDYLENYTGRIKLAKPFPFFEKSSVLNKPRVGFVTGLDAGMYTAANIWWSNAWYSKYGRSKFHFFNDFGEWNQMDKISHAFSAYFISKWTGDLFSWAGVKEKHAIWIGMLNAQMWQLSIEINDGFQDKWGFSWGDIAFNLTGSLFYGIQQYLWHDQKIQLKISAKPERYPSKYQARTDDLYGTSFTELILKDYNAMTYWLSVSPGAFIKNPASKYPKWLQFSLGYGAAGMLGGHENKWCASATSDIDISNCDPSDIVVADDMQRIRQFYLSADIDWTKIPVKRAWARTCLGILNIIKLPFPALELNNSDSNKAKFHWLMF